MALVFSLTAASTALNIATTTAVQPIPLNAGQDAPNASSLLGDQIMAIDVVSDSSTESGTVVVFLVDPNQATDIKVRVVEFTLSVPTNAYRAATAGASGGYVCKVTGPDLTNKVDLLGLARPSVPVTAAGVVGSKAALPLQWYLGCYSKTGGTLTVHLSPTRDN